MTREADLGRSLQAVGRRIVDEGQATSQRLHDWKRVESIQVGRGSCPDCAGEGYRYDVEQVQCDTCKGTGDYSTGSGGSTDGKLDRHASRMASEWTVVRLQLDQLAKRADHLMDQAKADHRPLDKHRTPAQVEVDGWCGWHWSAAQELVPITLRSTGEPYYKGRCRNCGSWPGGDPPIDVLRTWRNGKTPRVKAS